MMVRIAIDIGGTFTDFIALDGGGGVVTLKLPTDNKDPLGVIKKGLGDLAGRLDCSPEELIARTAGFTHGNTIAINALIEKKGVKTALITTLGFRDALEMRRSRRKDQWDFFAPVPPVLVPRRLRFGLRERMDYSGAPLAPVDRDQLEEIAGRLESEDIGAVAVCLLFSYQNPAHEKEVGEVLRRRLPGVFVSLSSEVSPRIREYERTSTTVLNAYLSPLLAGYLGEIEELVKNNGGQGQVWMMQNNGGLTDAGSAGSCGVKGLFSGPAGGARGARALAELTGHPDMVMVDMGGTSFDVTLVRDFQNQVCPDSEVEGYHVNMPMLDIYSIGAGGGSIARVDGGGMLKVGPRSAGANPGPACYGRGGTEPTITDAALVLGLLNAENFLGGKIRLNYRLARQALEDKVAGPLGLGVEDAALAVYRVSAALMTDAVHLNTVRRGHDPRGFVLAACGGASPLFAGQIAEGLGIAKIIVPANSSLFCAEGMLYAGAQCDFSQSMIRDLNRLNPGELEAALRELLERGRAELNRLKIPAASQVFRVYFEMKYSDQHHEIPVEFKGTGFSGMITEEIRESFHRLHERLYGYSQPESPCQIVSIRVSASEEKKVSPLYKSSLSSTGDPAPKGDRPACWEGAGGFRITSVYDGDRLAPGGQILGPAIIEKAFSTILVGSNQKAACDKFGNIVITMTEVSDER